MGTKKHTRSFAWLTSISLMFSLVGGTLFGGRAHASSNGDSARKQASKQQYPVLSRFATDLTELARHGRLELGDNNDAEIDRLARILANDTGRNPVLVNRSENSTSVAVAEGLAQRIATGNVDAGLQNKRIFSLNLDVLFSGAKDPNLFASRLKSILNEIAGSRGNVILFVNELHQFVGSYANEPIAAVLRDALEHGQIRMIGSATIAAYGEYIAPDESLTSVLSSPPKPLQTRKKPVKSRVSWERKSPQTCGN
jgi:ATP-dependent Clp protease ATP-binding subunit ClpB